MTVFQNPRQVAIALRDDTLSEREKLNFVWVSIAIASIFGEASILSALARPNVAGLILLVPWGIQIWGIMASFRANRRGDNQNFIERLICLTTALSIRASLVSFVLSALIYSLIYWPPLSSLIFLLTGLVTIGLNLYVYIRLPPLMTQAAGGTDLEGAPNPEP